MTYQSLARKYRPATFRDLAGQDGVARALVSAIAMGREQSALILTGVRGVGKTTIARLFAKAVNCAHRGADGEPCNQCESCRAISEGRHEDVLEIDGASNTGVADVRLLQETLEYVPQRSRFKVYIIDEVHMLSQAAFNALLKTIEEPPPQVKFVFATTEINRVPETILSRCQAFYLRKLPTHLIRQRLTEILANEGIAAEEKAVAAVAREGHGSMRDALTLLDQAIALGEGRVTYASLAPVVGSLSSSPYLELVAALVRRDAPAALRLVESFDEAGAEFRTVAEETAAFVRHAFVLRGLGPKSMEASRLGLDDEEMTRLVEVAGAAAELDLNRMFRVLARCAAELDGSTLDRFIFENCLYEWCFDPGLPDVDQLLAALGGAATPARSGRAPAARAGAEPVARPGAGAQAAAGQEAPARPAVEAARPPAEVPAKAPAEPRSLLSGLRQAVADAAPRPVPEAAPKSAPPSPPGPAVAPAEPVAKAEPVLPATWRDLVEAWKQRKPLSARKLEEAHPLEFGAAVISLLVSESSFASKCLLQVDEQVKLKEAFRELFGFQGQLRIGPAPKTTEAGPPAGAAGPMRSGAEAAGTDAPAAPGDAPEAAAAPAALPETILETRTKEADRLRQLRIEAAKSAPVTRDLVAALGGRIEGVRIPDGSIPGGDASR